MDRELAADPEHAKAQNCDPGRSKAKKQAAIACEPRGKPCGGDEDGYENRPLKARCRREAKGADESHLVRL